MMDDLIIKILFAIAMFVGFIGAVLPVLPGSILAFGSLFLAKILGFSEINWWIISIFGLFTILGIILDYLVPIVATKKMGGSRYGVIGMLIGLVVGIVFAPFGLISIILAPFLGALIGELMYDRKSHKRALISALGSVVGYLLTSGYGMMLSMAILAVFLWKDVL